MFQLTFDKRAGFSQTEMGVAIKLLDISPAGKAFIEAREQAKAKPKLEAVRS